MTSAAGCNNEKAEKKASEINSEITNETNQPEMEMKTHTPTPDATHPGGTKVKIKTKFGDMVAVLYDETPKHRDNFLKLAREGFFDGLLFHRCIKGFMVQGGDPESRNAAAGKMLGSGGPGYTVDAEFNSKFIHKKGALSAARQGDQVNPEKKSSGSQFYIVQGQPTANPQSTVAYTPEQKQIYTTSGGTPFLDGAYTVFGEVIEGLDVIDKIASQPTKPGDRPMEDIVMDIDVIN